ncbi:calcium-binding protein [Microvirga sp. M2]|uniref:calcium-binding protein n=1 Tax=Microvirga sp. M2 TaxID=3073270 RepID=UPI0039C34429
MPYELAAQRLHDDATALDPNTGDVIDPLARQEFYGSASPWAIDGSGLTGYAVQGEVLGGVRVSQSMVPAELEAPWGNPLDRHKQSLLVMMLYAKQIAEAGGTAQSRWTNLGAGLIASLFSTEIAQAVGAGTIQGTSSADEKLRSMIAYSAIDEGTRPFGDSAIRALFDDANELGNLLGQANVSQTLREAADALSKIIVQYAGRLAMEHDTSDTGKAGILAAGQDLLFADLSPATWNPDGEGSSAIIGKEELLQELLHNGGYDERALGAGMLQLWGSDSHALITQIAFLARELAGAVQLPAQPSAPEGATMVVGTDAADTIAGSGADELILGGDGADTLSGGAGRDLLLGGAGNDTLLGGAGDDVLVGGAGNDTASYKGSDVQTGLRATLGRADINGSAGLAQGFQLTSPTSGHDLLFQIERIELTDKADHLTIRANALQFNPLLGSIVIDMGASERDQDFIGNVDVVDYSQVAQGIVYDNGKVFLDGGRTSTAIVVENADKVVLTNQSDVLKSAAVGTIVETGGGADRVWFNKDIGISDLSGDDGISLFGAMDLFGGLRNKYSESPYAVSWGGMVEWGINTAGELVIRLPWWGEGGAEMYVLNWQRDAGANGRGPGNILLREYEIGVYRLLDPNRPSHMTVMGMWELFGAMVKTMTEQGPWKGIDPLVLDLDGDGIELSTQSSISPVFDIDGDLYGEHTGWVKPDDGFLVRDVDGNGRIDDVREMFGGARSGFAALAELDGNHDGRVDASDSGLADFNGDGIIDAGDTFSALRIWQDLDQDGITDAGELKSLDQLGIVSIGVQGTQAGRTVNGNRITAVGTYTRADGTTCTVADVVLRVDNGATVYQGGPITITDDAKTRPDLAGFGTLVSLREAMSVMPSATPRIDAALTHFTSPNLAALREAAQPILQAWAQGSPVRLPNGQIVTGAAGLNGYHDIAILKNGDDVVDYSYGFSAQTTQTESGSQTLSTWNFASGTIVRVRTGAAPAPASLADIRNETPVSTSPETTTVVIDGITYMANSYSYATGMTVSILTRGSSGSAVASHIVDHGQDTYAWSTLRGTELAFMERYLGETLPFHTKPTNHSAALQGMKLALETIDATLNSLAVRLAVQNGPLAQYFEGIRYDAENDCFKGITDRQLIPVFEELLSAASDASSPLQWLNEWKPFLDVVIGDYTRGNAYLLNTYGFLAQNIIAAFEAVSPDLALHDVFDVLGVPPELLITGSGIVQGSNEADIFYLDGGDQLLRGGLGRDTYIVGAHIGHDVIDDYVAPLEARNDDVLRFTTFRPQDIVATRDGIDLILTVTATGETIRVKDQFEGESPNPFINDTSPDTGIAEIVFADGTVWTSLDIAKAVARPDPASTILTGTADNDYIYGGAGNDTLSGLGDGDIYWFGRGDGNDVVEDKEDNIFRAAPDILQFKDGLRFGDLVFSRQANSDDVLITFKQGADSILIKGQFKAAYTGPLGIAWIDRIELFTFDDGSAFTYKDLMNFVQARYTTSGDDTIYGFSREDRLDGGAGNDYLSGGNENDTYVFGRGYGQDTIEDNLENILSGDNDTLEFTAGIAVDDVWFRREGESLDLLVGIIGTDDQVRIKNWYQVFETGPFGPRAFDLIEQFRWADGTAKNWWTIAKGVIDQSETAGDDLIVGTHFNDTLDGGAGNDTMKGSDGDDRYLFGRGYGQDIVEDYESNLLATQRGDRVLFGSDVGTADLEVFRTSGDPHSMTLRIRGTNDTLTLKNFCDYLSYEIEWFEFADGTIWTSSQIGRMSLERLTSAGNDRIEGFRIQDVLAGAGGNDSLYGGSGSDTLIGGTGNDYLQGDLGNDIYRFELGDGQDTIYDGSGWSTDVELDTLVLGAGIDPANVTVSQAANGQDLVLSIVGTADQITLRQQISGTYGGVDQVQFADGTLWNRTQLIVKSTPATNGDDVFRGGSTSDILAGAGGNDSLYGGSGSDTLIGGTGNDYLQGDLGNDTYRFELGDGQDTIYDGSGWSTDVELDTLVLGAGIDPANVTVSQAANGQDLVLSIVGTADQITLRQQISGTYGGVDQVQFADGTLWNRTQLIERSTIATEGNDIFYGDSTANLLNGAGGNDTLYGGSGGDTLIGGIGSDSLSGGSGGDTYIFNVGDGQDVIAEAGSDTTDVLLFGAGISAVQVLVTQAGSGHDLVLTIGTDKVTLDEAITNAIYRVDEVHFADGTTWTYAHLFDMATTATAGNDVFYGDERANSLSGGAGNDSLSGASGDDTLTGGAGNDSVSGGSGSDTYQFDRGDGQDIIYDNGVGSGDVDILLLGAGIGATDITVAEAGSGHDLVLTIGPDKITFDEAIFGSSNRVEEVHFADGTIWTYAQMLDMATVATAANDLFYGDERANALNGGAGNDSLYGGSGNDTLAGGTGNDFLRGESGSDTYVFNVGDGQDIISDSGFGSGDVDVLQFGSGISAANVTVSQADTGRDLVLTIGADKVTLDDVVNSTYYRIEDVRFGDGTVWTYAQLFDMATAATSGNDLFYGDERANSLSGGAGNDTLSGGSGNDTLVGGAGNDSLTGGLNSDTFVFAAGFGVDVITDFKAGANTEDVIEFSTAVFSGYAAVLAASTQSGSNVMITAGAGNTITLKNVTLSSLHADDFRFV